MATQFSQKDGIQWKRRFFSIFSSQAFSLLGSQLVSFAIVWYLTVSTGSATVLTTASLVGVVPSVALGPFIGPLVDRWNRKRTMIIADLVIAAATFGLAVIFFFDVAQLWHIYLLLFIRSSAGSFHGSSMGASTSLMVPVEQMARIQGLNQMLNGGLNVVSAPLGALLYELVPMQGILMMDVVTAIVAVFVLSRFEIPQPDRSQSEALAGEESSYFKDIATGLKYIISWRGMLIIALMAAFLNFLLSPASSLQALLIRDYFGGGALQLGTVNSIFGFSVIAGGLLLSLWGGFKKKIITSMSGLIGIGIGAAAIGLAGQDQFYIMLIAVGAMGLSLPIANGAMSAVMMAQVAPDLQGRVFGTIGSLAGIMMPIGLAIAGPVAERFGLQIWYLVAGFACVAMALLGLMLPDVVHIDERNPNNQPDQTEDVVSVPGSPASVEADASE
jgi:DHA3 family macrolide efflux protein-like MFS transporter